MTTVAIVVATVLSYFVGWALKLPLLVPVFNTLASFPFMVAALRRGDVRLAITRMLLWALTLAVCATAFAYLRPWEAGRMFANGARYRGEMFAWIMTGRGAESTPSQFIPQHARDAALFAVVDLVSGGFAGMAMGAALMNYMGTYVGSLAAASRYPLVAIFLGWHPWAVIRVVSFVVIGVVLSIPLLSRVFHFRSDGAERRRLLTWAAVGLIADVTLKALLAPAWRNLLLRVAGW
jgi:hypothetical protein